MGSQETTDPLSLTWLEIITCAFIGAAFVSASYGAILFTISFGLSAVALAILSLGESTRKNKE